MVEVTFQGVRHVTLKNEQSKTGPTSWFEISITDDLGVVHSIVCFPTAANEIPVIFNPGMERENDGR